MPTPNRDPIDTIRQLNDEELQTLLAVLTRRFAVLFDHNGPSHRIQRPLAQGSDGFLAMSLAVEREIARRAKPVPVVDFPRGRNGDH